MAGQAAGAGPSAARTLADIAHELRTPLAVMQGRLEGVLDGVYHRTDARSPKLLQETRMLSRLVEDLGTLAHSERGVLGLRKEPTDISALVHDAVRRSSRTRARGERTLRWRSPAICRSSTSIPFGSAK